MRYLKRFIMIFIIVAFAFCLMSCGALIEDEVMAANQYQHIEDDTNITNDKTDNSIFEYSNDWCEIMDNNETAGKDYSEMTVLEQFASRMKDEPVEYFVGMEDELRSCELDFDSVANKHVLALGSGYGFDLYTMDDNKIEYVYCFSETGEMQYHKDGRIMSKYSTEGREIVCISNFTDHGVKLLETYEKRLINGKVHYFKGVSNQDPDYVGEHCISVAEDGCIITASTFRYDGDEISENEFIEFTNGDAYGFTTLKFEDMPVYEGPFSRVDW